MSLAERIAKSERPDRLTDVRSRVQERLVESLGPRLYDPSLSEQQVQVLVHARVLELLAARPMPAAPRPPKRVKVPPTPNPDSVKQ